MLIFCLESTNNQDHHNFFDLFPGKDLSENALAAAERFRERICNDLHDYYVNSQQTPNYAGRLMKLMAIVHSIEVFIKTQFNIHKGFDGLIPQCSDLMSSHCSKSKVIVPKFSSWRVSSTSSNWTARRRKATSNISADFPPHTIFYL